MSKMKDGVRKPLSHMESGGYVLGESRFDRLNGWTSLMIMVDESTRALELSEKYKKIEEVDKLVKTKVERIEYEDRLGHVTVTHTAELHSIGLLIWNKLSLLSLEQRRLLPLLSLRSFSLAITIEAIRNSQGI